MFLFERLFGIGTYMLALLLVCFLLIKTNASCKAVLRFYLICLCIMAFFYKPYITADLYRIFEQMDYFATMEFKPFWEEFALTSPTPLSRLLFWFIGKSGSNKLLPMLSAFGCYYFLFYIINKTKKIYNISNQTVAIVLFYLMTTSIYISVIGGIRMMLALTMITFSYFRATVEKKFTLIDLVFFIAPIFIHTMSFVVVGIIALSLLFDSKKNLLKKIVYICFIGMATIVFLVKFSNTANILYQKFLDYIFGDKHSDPWEYIMGIFIIITLLVSLFEFRHIYKENFSRIKKCNLVSMFCIILAIIFCFEFSIFYRFGGHLAVMFSIPSTMIALENTSGKSSSLFKGIELKTIVIILSLIIAAISCSRGSLCSLKFFEL